MIKTTLNWTIKNLKHMYDAKETLSFDHPIQRQSAQWSNLQQSLLIHSILANFPVPAIYVQKSDAEEADDKGKTLCKYSVLDGKQRMTTIFSFINGEYALNEETPDAEIEGENYSLAGKTFGELDVDVQQELLRFLEDSVRFFHCQFVIATHSPFLLSMRGARIYDLDEEVVDVKRWTELGNVRAYYEFFKKYEKEFR